jgi:membrane protease YdiL (CAAX protease family)
VSQDDPTAAALRGFGPLGLAAILIILLAGNVSVNKLPVFPAGGVLVLLWAWRSRTPWRDIGYARPNSWVRAVIAGIVFGAALKIVMKMIVMPLLGAPPVNQAYQFLIGNNDLLPAAIWAMFVAGFSEETVYRGFLFERLRTLFGWTTVAKIGIVLVTSVWFAVVHYTGQGLPGVEQAAVVGLVFGGIFARTRSLWMLMCAHTAFDLTALALIYWNLERDVAQLIFK